jgi:hypothetical protein
MAKAATTKTTKSKTSVRRPIVKSTKKTTKSVAKSRQVSKTAKRLTKSVAKRAGKVAAKNVKKAVAKAVKKVAPKTKPVKKQPTKPVQKAVPKPVKPIQAVKPKAATKPVQKAVPKPPAQPKEKLQPTTRENVPIGLISPVDFHAQPEQEVVQPPKKITKLTIKNETSRVELLSAIKRSIEKGLVLVGPEVGGINKLSKTGLLNLVNSNNCRYIYNLIMEARKTIQKRELSVAEKRKFDILNSYTCRQLVDAIKLAKVIIPSVHTAKKLQLIFSILDSAMVDIIIEHLPVKPVQEQEAVQNLEIESTPVEADKPERVEPQAEQEEQEDEDDISDEEEITDDADESEQQQADEEEQAVDEEEEEVAEEQEQQMQEMEEFESDEDEMDE